MEKLEQLQLQAQQFAEDGVVPH